MDDDPINRMVTGRMLDKLGIEHVAVEHGAEALERLSDEPQFGMVLMDCEMPVMDGFTATTRIRADEGTGRHIPIVGLTAHAAIEDRERGLRAGMTDYRTKPLRIDDLRELAETHLAPRPVAPAPRSTP